VRLEGKQRGRGETSSAVGGKDGGKGRVAEEDGPWKRGEKEKKERDEVRLVERGVEWLRGSNERATNLFAELNAAENMSLVQQRGANRPSERC